MLGSTLTRGPEADILAQTCGLLNISGVSRSGSTDTGLAWPVKNYASLPQNILSDQHKNITSNSHGTLDLELKSWVISYGY